MNDQQRMSIPHLKERQRFNLLLLQNPNYFGNLAQTELKPVLELKGDTTYEEIGCVGFQPRLKRLDAVVFVKQPAGYGGRICSDGTPEHVRFYLSFDGGATWEDQGVASFTAHDVPQGAVERRRLEYSVALEIEPPRELCQRANLVLARAILSWNQEPPPNQPNWRPVWGDVHDTHIQIEPLRRVTARDLPQITKGEAAAEAVPELDPDHQIALARPRELGLAELQELYRNQDVEPHRFAMKEVQKLAAQPGLATAVALTDPIDKPALVDFGFDLPEVLKLLDEPTGNTSYEELECSGLDPDRSELVAVFRIKRGSGYSGGQCTTGSTEYVTFWADLDDNGSFETCLGTAAVRVYDFGNAIPDQGLEYSVSLPVDLHELRQPCEKGPRLVRIRAMLSWNAAHDCGEPEKPPVWGNAEDTVILVPPGRRRDRGDFHPFLDTVSGVDVCRIDWQSGYAVGDRPFGATLRIAGEIPAAVINAPDRFKYKVWVRPLLAYGIPSGGWQALANKFSVRVRESFAPGLASIYWLDQEVDGDGWYTYREYGSATGLPYRRVISPARLLVPWNTTAAETGMWEIRIESKDTTDGSIYLAGTSVCEDGSWRQNAWVYLDQVRPEAEIAITGLSRGGAPVEPAEDCGTFQIGDEIHGSYSATDEHFRVLTMTVEPADVAHGAAVSPSARAYPIVPTAGEAGSWTLDTSPMEACGYVVRLQVWDRTIVNGSSLGWKDVDSVGFCLEEPPA